MDAKTIQKHIDELVEKVDDGEVTLPPEAIDLLDEIVSYATLIKAKDKTKPIEELVGKLDNLIQTITTGSQESTQAVKQSHSELLQAIQQIKIDVASPQVSVAAPQVNVKVPPVRVPAAEITLPKEMSIEKPSWLSGLINLKPVIDAIQSLKFPSFNWPTSASKPMSVRLSDGEKFYRSLGGGGGSTSYYPKVVTGYGVIDQTATGTTELVAAQGAKLKIKLVSYVFTMSEDGTARFTSANEAIGAGSNLTGDMNILASGGAVSISVPEAPLFQTEDDSSLSIVTTVGKAKGHFSYIVEA